MSDDTKRLGGTPTAQPTKLLDSFANPAPQRDYEIAFECPEFTCLCPVTGQPDFATLRIRYSPAERCVELKSLKLYIWSFRNEGHFHGAVTNRILDDLVAPLAPRRLTVVGDFLVRGGIHTVATASYEAPKKILLQAAAVGIERGAPGELRLMVQRARRRSVGPVARFVFPARRVIRTRGAMDEIRISAGQNARFLDVIYALDGDDRSYLRALCDAWLSLGVAGDIGAALAHRACPDEIIALEALEASPPELAAIGAQVSAGTPRPYRLRMLTAPAGFTFAARAFGKRALIRSRELGFPDFVGFLGPTGTGFSVTVGSPLPPGRNPRFAQPQLLQAIADHLAAAWRLRKRLQAPDAFADSAEAVCRTDGRVLEAAGPAKRGEVRERLRRVVVARERAMRAGEGPAWSALLDGKYTIVDRFERGGARYVVAYRNPRTAARIVGVTPLERRVLEGAGAGVMNKVTALELGVSTTKVSTLLHAGLRRLGLSTAIDLTLLASSSSFVALDDEVLGPQIVAAFALRGAASDGLLALTPAERAVAADLLRGCSNREIAARRNRSERTVANQVHSVLEKLRVPSRRALVAELARRTSPRDRVED